MTKQETVKAVQALGLFCKWDGSDFRVSFPVLYYTQQGFGLPAARARAEATAYYTNCSVDAVLTGKSMALELGALTNA